MPEAKELIFDSLGEHIGWTRPEEFIICSFPESMPQQAFKKLCATEVLGYLKRNKEVPEVLRLANNYKLIIRVRDNNIVIYPLRQREIYEHIMYRNMNKIVLLPKGKKWEILTFKVSTLEFHELCEQLRASTIYT